MGVRFVNTELSASQNLQLITLLLLGGEMDRLKRFWKKFRRWLVTVILMGVFSEVCWVLLAYLLSTDFKELTLEEWEKLNYVMSFMSVILGLIFGSVWYCYSPKKD